MPKSKLFKTFPVGSVGWLQSPWKFACYKSIPIQFVPFDRSSSRALYMCTVYSGHCTPVCVYIIYVGNFAPPPTAPTVIQ